MYVLRRGRTQRGFYALWRPVCVLGAWKNALGPLIMHVETCVRFGGLEERTGVFVQCLDVCILGGLQERTGAQSGDLCAFCGPGRRHCMGPQCSVETCVRILGPGRTRWGLYALWRPECVFGGLLSHSIGKPSTGPMRDPTPALHVPQRAQCVLATALNAPQHL